MRYLASQKVRYAIAFLIGSVIGTAYVFSAIQANADTIPGVSIAGNGLTIVRGAHVEAVSGSEIIASSQWGKTSFKWYIIVDGMTRFSPAREKRTLDDMVEPGQIIDFSGRLEQSEGVPTVRAESVHNETLMRSRTAISGTLLSTDGSNLTLLTEDGTSTVHLNDGTILTQEGNRADVGDLVVGSAIRAFGTMDALGRILEADRVTSSVATPGIPNTGAPQPPRAPQSHSTNLLQNVAAWLSVRGGALSVRRIRKRAI